MRTVATKTPITLALSTSILKTNFDEQNNIQPASSKVAFFKASKYKYIKPEFQTFL